jgi:hypothetical protein
VQDLPPLNSASSTPAPSASRLDEPFCVSLQRTLRALNVQPALNLMLREHPHLPLKSIDDLSRWDWSKVKARLIPSLAGKHTGWHEVLKNGHPRLMAALRSLGLRAGKGREVVIECQVCRVILALVLAIAYLYSRVQASGGIRLNGSTNSTILLLESPLKTILTIQRLSATNCPIPVGSRFCFPA